MRNNLLKISIVLCFSVLFLSFGLKAKRVSANSGGPPASRTGAPGEQTCAISGCHTGSTINSGGGALTVTGVPTNYTPNQEVDITVTLIQAGRIRFGFEATVIDDQGRAAGTLSITESGRTQLISNPVGGNLRQYIQHSFNGTSANGGSNQGRWTFHWKAPAQSVGRVTFYVAGNAANNNGSQSGDLIYTTSASSQPGAVITNVTTVSAASFAQGSLTAESIVAGFGIDLSQNVVLATSVPLPTQLDGTEVVVRDSTNTDRNAPLFFVAPTQVNYLIPAGTANGAATVSVKRSGTTVAQGTIQIELVAPGLFSANASGTGVAAADALRVIGSQQIFERVSTISNGQITAVPIDLGPETDQMFLILYGTSFRNNGGLNNVSVTVGGTSVPVLFAAAQGVFAGLDQCNIGPLPRTLIGRGNVNIVLTSNTKVANTVTVNIK